MASAAPTEGQKGPTSGSEEEAAAAAEAEDSEKENVVKKELVEEAASHEEDLEALKAKVRKLEENNKCSKCMVS